MPDPAGTRLVANSYVLAELAVVVLSEHAGEITASQPEPEESAATELLHVIRNNHHVIVTTENLIEREYEPTSQRYGLTPLLPGLRLLASEGLVRRARRESLPTLTGVPQEHRRFFQEALRTGSQYFLTRRESWLGLRDRLSERHNLLVVTPEEYVQRQTR